MQTRVILICTVAASCLTFAQGTPAARGNSSGVGTIQNISPHVDCVIERSHVRRKASLLMRLLPGDQIVVNRPENGSVTIRIYGAFDHVLSMGHERYRVPDGPGLAELMENASRFFEQRGSPRARPIESDDAPSLVRSQSQE